MGKKVKLFSLFKNGGLLTMPLCSNSRTLSFRVGDDAFKTVNSVFFDQNADVLDAESTTTTTPPDSWFTNSSETASFSTESELDMDAESLEMVVRRVVRSSERLFFEPEETSLVKRTEKDSNRKKKKKKKKKKIKMKKMKEKECSSVEPLRESVFVAMESEDPYEDFRRSMEEIVRSQDGLVKDWECLEAMLGCYLSLNGKDHHGVIVSAFADLLVSLVGGGGDASESALASDSACYSSVVTSFPSSPTCSSQCPNEIEEVVQAEVKRVLF